MHKGTVIIVQVMIFIYFYLFFYRITFFDLLKKAIERITF